MLKIGEFSKLSRVSIRMLRHYDDIGLIKPVQVDDLTGYRYYREDQLYQIGRITALKDMGFGLADIVRMLEIYDDKDGFLMKMRSQAKVKTSCTSTILTGREAARQGTLFIYLT